MQDGQGCGGFGSQTKLSTSPRPFNAPRPNERVRRPRGLLRWIREITGSAAGATIGTRA